MFFWATIFLHEIKIIWLIINITNIHCLINSQNEQNWKKFKNNNSIWQSFSQRISFMFISYYLRVFMGTCEMTQLYLVVEDHLRSFLFHNFLWILLVNKRLHVFHIVILNVCAYVYKFQLLIMLMFFWGIYHYQID